jgi:hypothetical protein
MRSYFRQWSPTVCILIRNYYQTHPWTQSTVIIWFRFYLLGAEPFAQRECHTGMTPLARVANYGVNSAKTIDRICLQLSVIKLMLLREIDLHECSCLGKVRVVAVGGWSGGRRGWIKEHSSCRRKIYWLSLLALHNINQIRKACLRMDNSNPLTDQSNVVGNE